MAGVTGFDYNVLPMVMKLRNIEDEATVFNDIRVMEGAALAKLHEDKGG